MQTEWQTVLTLNRGAVWSESLQFAQTGLSENLGSLRYFVTGLQSFLRAIICDYLDRVKRICYLSPMRAAKVQASLPIRAVSPESPLLDHTSSESRGTFRQKARSLAPLNGWACAVKICHNRMLKDTNSLDGAHLILTFCQSTQWNTKVDYNHLNRPFIDRNL